MEFQFLVALIFYTQQLSHNKFIIKLGDKLTLVDKMLMIH